MKKAFILASALIMAAAMTAKAQEITSAAPTSGYIEVNGYAEQELAPDVFYLRIEINESDSKGKTSLQEQQSTMVNTLRSLGVDTDKYLTRTSLSSHFFNKKTNMASATYRLKLTSADTVSKVWGALDSMGISGVSFEKAEYGKMDEVKEEIQRKAIQNAREKAVSLAGAIGQSVGRCFYIYAGEAGTDRLYSMPVKARMYNMADTEESAAENIQFGNIKISASVSAKFVLL